MPPFVEGTSTKRSYLWHPAVFFAVAFVSGSISSFLVVAAAGTRVGHHAPDLAMLTVVAVSGSVLVAHEVRGLAKQGFVALGMRRQTPKRLQVLGSPRIVSALWGFDAGLGFSTYRVTNGWWLLAVMVAGSTLAPLPVGIAYGVGFTAGLLFNLSRRGATIRLDPLKLLVHLPTVRRAVAVIEVVFTIVLVSAVAVLAIG